MSHDLHAVILQVPCTDDMLLFDSHEEAETWIAEQKLQPSDYAWGRLTRPTGTWRRL
jgi:hypothetical protein